MRKSFIGNISGKQSLQIFDIPFSESDQKTYTIYFSARNGFFYQHLLLSHTEGHWQYAIQVNKDTNGEREILFEKISDQYPRDERGTVQWPHGKAKIVELSKNVRISVPDE